MIQNKIAKDTEVELSQSLNAVLETSHQAVRSWFDEHKSTVSIWAHSPEVRQAATTLLAISHKQTELLASHAQSQLRSWFQPLQQVTGYQDYFIVGPDNINLASSRDQDVGVENLLIKQDQFLQLVWSGNTVMSLPEKSDVALLDNNDGQLREGLLSMFVGSPIFDEAGRVIAIFTFCINPEEGFTRLLQKGRIGNSGEIYAFDRQGRLISNSRFDVQLRASGLISSEERGMLNIEIRDPGVNLLQIESSDVSMEQYPFTTMAASAISGESASDLTGYRDYRGVTVVGAWLWDEQLGFGITIEQNKQEAYQTLHRTQNVILMLTILMILLIIGMTIIIVIYHQSRLTLAALHKSEALHRYLFENAGVGIVHFELQSDKILQANDYFCQFVGYGQDELRHMRLLDFTHPEDVVNESPVYLKKEVNGNSDSFKLEKRYICKNGCLRWGYLNSNVIRDKNGNIIASIASIAAITDITERKLGEQALQRSEVLEQLATGATLNEILTALVLNAEKHSPGMFCSVLLLTKDGKHLYHGAAPSLPDYYNEAIDGVAIGGDEVSCAAAAYIGERVVVEEIMSHPNWVNYRDLAERAGLRACWSEPVISCSGDILGTFTIYYREPRMPTQSDLDFISDSTRLAAIAIEHKQAEEALRASEARLKCAQNVVKVGDWELDVVNNSLLWSDETYRIFGVPGTEVMSYEKFIEHVHPDDVAHLNNAWKTALEGKKYDEEHRIVVDGETKWVHEKSYFEFDKEGNAIRALGTVQDITKRKLAEEQARQHLVDLAHMARLNTMGELATGIAHELNQPLSAINTYAAVSQKLLKSEVSQQKKLSEVLEAIAVQAMRASEIIRRLRQFVKKQTPQKTMVVLNDLVLEVLTFTEPEIRKQHVQLLLELTDRLPAVCADAIQIEQVLVNLVRNSLEAMELTSTRNCQLAIRTYLNQNGLVQVEVTDTGAGIDAKTLSHIFESYVTTKGAKGMGVGLSISRSIIEGHGGHLWVKSERGKGASFFFTFPLKNNAC